MRFIGIAIVASSLSACSFSPGALHFNNAAEPLPSGYRALLDEARQAEGWIAASEPRTILGETVFAPRRWYVCVLSEDGTQAAVVFSGGKIAGVIGGDPPELCAGLSYATWG